MTISTRPPRWFAIRRFIPFALLLVGTALAIGAARYAVSTADDRLSAAFLGDAAKARHDVEARLNSHFDVVRATGALLTANNEISGADFRAFVSALELRRQYPGLKGIGFAPRVPAQSTDFHQFAELDGTKIWPQSQDADLYPLLFLEPGNDGNLNGIGLDLATDGMVDAAIERARDTGRPIVAQSAALAPAAGAPHGTTLVFLVPIYQRFVPVGTVNQRRRALAGFVLSLVDMDDLLHGVMLDNPSTALEVYDSRRPEAATVRYSSAAEGRTYGYESGDVVQVAGEPWLVLVKLAPRSNTALADGRAIFGTGLVLALLLYALTRAQVRGWETTARHEADLRRLALHDALTDLPNRALLDDRLAKAIAGAQRNNHRLAVLFIDVDDFKQINDVWGHATGDDLLRSVAERLQGSVRRSDTVSRHGGDEFVLLLTDIDQPQHAAELARGLIEAVTLPHYGNGRAIDITVSVGVSIYPDDGREAGVLLQAADAAMYQAKESGRNTYQFFTPEMNAHAITRQTVEAGLRRALAREELELHYQPKVSLETGVISGVEALVRWRDPERGLIGPTEFVSIAEESGLIVPVGRWALREACRQARVWLEAGFPVPVAVNVSAIELRVSDFLEQARRILRETRLDPRYLELELTESILVRRAPSVVRLLQSLRALGVTIAIDDFGTGYSSVTYLRQFPVDVLKVDQSFVHEVAAAPVGSPIVSAMINMGRSLGHRVIAEGVETAEQYAFLRAQHCSEGQGFFFSRPMPAGELTAYLVARPSGVVLKPAGSEWSLFD